MEPHDRARRLAVLALQLQQAHEEQPTAQTVIDRALQLVPDADWVSLTVRASRRTFVTLAATADEARQVDELQYTLREGPCVDAATGAEWHRSSAVRHDPRWTRWGPQAADIGVGSMLSVQLATDEPLGALNMYARREGRFEDHDEVDFALLYGTHVAIALTAAREADGLRSAMATRHAIGIAQGMLMERYGLSVEASFNLLRRYSSNHNVKLTDIAADIVATRQVPATELS